VVDAAIVDGATHLLAAVHQLSAMGLWSAPRGENLLDGGAPFYDTYRCADGKFVSVAPLEPEFYALLIGKLGLKDHPAVAIQFDAAQWPAMRRLLADTFASQPRDHWTALLEGADACFAPVLDIHEARDHPHMQARGVFEAVDGVMQAAPAPRFSRTPGAIQGPAPRPGADTEPVLADWGFSASDIAALKAGGALG